MRQIIISASLIFYLAMGMTFPSSVILKEFRTQEKTWMKIESNLIFKVDKLVEAWITMWNSYDLSMVDKLFLVDSRVTYFFEKPRSAWVYGYMEWIGV